MRSIINGTPKTLVRRIAASAVSYVAFAGVTIAWLLTQNETLKWVMFIPLFGAVFILPRDIRGFDVPEESATRVRLSLSYLRLVYFLGAVALMIGVPEFLSS